jgi:hypothetical protein
MGMRWEMTILTLDGSETLEYTSLLSALEGAELRARRADEAARDGVLAIVIRRVRGDVD